MSNVKLDVTEKFDIDENNEYTNFDFPGEKIFALSEPDVNANDTALNENILTLQNKSSELYGPPDEPIVEFKIPLESEIDVPLQDNDESPNSSYGAKATSAKFGPGSFQDRRQSIFAHSSPSQFPDILKARKSAFGSIFVRASAIRGESLSGRRWLSSSQSVSPRGASSPEKVSGASSDSDKRLLLSLGLKDSVFRAFEKRGIPKEPSSSSSSQWDVYPITESALFSVQVKDQIHQTRHISRIEERILTGPQQFLKFSYRWPTGSMWTGHWDALGMAGAGTYIMPHDVVYHGKMHDGMFHDDNGLLQYPNGFTALRCKYHYGWLQSCQFRFEDSLLHEKEDWGYCTDTDRRFWGEVQTGLKPGKVAQITPSEQPRPIPNGCYDTSDGFFNPKTKMLISPTGDLLRVPTKAEEEWIRRNCRKGFQETVGFRPDLFEDWFDHDTELMKAVLEKQEDYKKGNITLDDLQIFYAENDLLPEHAPYRKNKTISEMALEEYLNSFPSPKPLKRRTTEKPGHQIPEEMITTVAEGLINLKSSKSSLISKKSKSLLLAKLEQLESSKLSSVKEDTFVTEKSVSKINFKLDEEKDDDDEESIHVSKSKSYLRIIGAGKVDSKSILKHPRPLDPLDVKESDLEDSRSHLKIAEEEILEKTMDSKVAERIRNRAAWSMPIPQKPFGPRNEQERCLDVLQELYDSIPDEEEYCDSEISKTCHFKKLSEDKFNSLKYWGKRMLMLDFGDEMMT